MTLIQVIEEGPVILHRIEANPSFKAGDRVAMVLDAARRRDHSQQHSGQHLLSAVLEREFGIHTLGFHLGQVYSTIDISCPSMDADIAARVEKIADGFIAQDHGYKVHACPPEDASLFPIRKGLPEGESVVRIVEIDGYDWVACCGTHVASAAALRLLSILSTEKYKGNTRVYFVAGDRAVAAMARSFGQLKAVAGHLGSSTEESVARVTTLLEKVTRLEAERGALLKDRAMLEIDIAASQNAQPIQANGIKILRFSFADRSADEAFETVKAGAARGFCVIALSSPDRCVQIMKAQASINEVNRQALGQLLKPLLQESGGKGGGGPNNFRAVFDTAEHAELFASRVASLLS
ncbi:MAG: hypothetical protein CVV53_01585 [Spirochaetae bacterium HGW-Spirochaetae-9]|nr:MAG: hypothetical protein CVV53_01585 [Spirochaetae bacterium HGW-Spirochaetae-9]